MLPAIDVLNSAKYLHSYVCIWLCRFYSIYEKI